MHCLTAEVGMQLDVGSGEKSLCKLVSLSRDSILIQL